LLKEKTLIKGDVKKICDVFEDLQTDEDFFWRFRDVEFEVFEDKDFDS